MLYTNHCSAYSANQYLSLFSNCLMHSNSFYVEQFYEDIHQFICIFHYSNTITIILQKFCEIKSFRQYIVFVFTKFFKLRKFSECGNLNKILSPNFFRQINNFLAISLVKMLLSRNFWQERVDFRNFKHTLLHSAVRKFQKFSLTLV